MDEICDPVDLMARKAQDLVKHLGRRVLYTCAFVAPAFLLIVYLGWMRSDSRWRHRFSVVEDGVLLRGPLPDVSELNELDRRYHVRTIINLLGRYELREHPECRAEREFASRHGIRFVHMPLDIPTRDQIRDFLDILNQPENRPVFIHCEDGTVRTGFLVAVHRIENGGWSNQKALEEMVSHGTKPQLSGDREITDFVRGYRRGTHRS